MATSTTGGGDRDTKSAFDCSICLEKFKNPKMLPCGHSFCESCLLPLIKFGRLDCPQCRQAAIEPSAGFPTNFALLQILERIEDEGENTAQGGIEPSQSPLDVNREQYERAREKLIATLLMFQSPELEMVRERHQSIGEECKELITETNESITKFFKNLSDERTAIEAMLANTFESLTITNSLKLFNRLPSFFDDKRFERTFTSVQRKVSNLEELLRRAAEIDEESYEMEEPMNRGNVVSSNVAAPSNEPPQSAAASSSASSEHQETSATRETWFNEQFVIEDKYSGIILGKYAARQHSIQNKYRCKLEFKKTCQADSRLIIIRGRDARLVTAAKMEIQRIIKAHTPYKESNEEGHVARACPMRSMVPKDLHGGSSVRSVRGRSSNIAGPSSSQTIGFGQSSRTTSNGGGYGGGDGDRESMASIERGRSPLDNDK